MQLVISKFQILKIQVLSRTKSNIMLLYKQSSKNTLRNYSHRRIASIVESISLSS